MGRRSIYYTLSGYSPATSSTPFPTRSTHATTQLPKGVSLCIIRWLPLLGSPSARGGGLELDDSTECVAAPRLA
jgi:hypothetical protein